MLVIWYERAMAFREIRCGGSPVMSSPANRMRPLVGRSTPVMQLKSVDLPAPLGPMMARISPVWIATSTLLRALSPPNRMQRSEEHTSELQSRFDLVCRLLLEKKKKNEFSILRNK